MKKIKFTKHAIKRAIERKLWGYVSKEKFYYDAVAAGVNTARIDDVFYAFSEDEKEIKITTIYKDLPINKQSLSIDKILL